MKNDNLISQRLLKISGIIIVVLGLIHCSASPFVIPMWKMLPKSEWLTCSYMFVCTGLALIFTGWLQYYLCKQKIVDSTGMNILFASVLLVLAMGIGAASVMFTNPFAFITLLIGLLEFYFLKSIHQKKRS